MKIHNILTETNIPETVTIKVSGDFVNEFKSFMEEVSKAASGGAGTELKAITGSGEIASCYIDGDGADRIEVK